MAEMRCRLAIVSDIHAHDDNDISLQDPSTGNITKVIESFLTTNAPKQTKTKHPVEALRMIRESLGPVSVLISCGDMTNKASEKGLQYARSVIHFELKDIFGVDRDRIFCVTGNHDIASRAEGDPFRLIPDHFGELPVSNTQSNDSYWRRGFQEYFIDSINLSILAINSAHDHYTSAKAKTGTLPDSCIEDMHKNLNKISYPEIGVVIIHHHPILHSHIGEPPNPDVIENGDQLLDILVKNGYKYILHGHKHWPRVKRHVSCGRDAFVCAIGSFSKMLDAAIATNTCNTFHILELLDDNMGHVSGKLFSWQYHHGKGWAEATRSRSGLDSMINLSEYTGDIDEIARRISEWVLSSERKLRDQKEIDDMYPCLLRGMLPIEHEQLVRTLRDVHGVECSGSVRNQEFEIGIPQ
jgi:calcineurin-like phosphoesterase family protein